MTHQDSHLPPVYAASYEHIGVILWGEKQLSDSVDRALAWLARHPDFRIGWDHEAFTYDYLAEHNPALLDTIRSALQTYAGRIGLSSCSYGQPLSMFISEESNIRQLTYGIETTLRRLGCPITVYLVSEHAFHAQMPQLLAGCGFRGAVLRTHFMMYGHNPEFDAPVGWWTGVDGSRVPALPTYCGQAATASLINDILPGNTSTLDNRILTDGPSERIPFTLADFRRAFGDRIQPLIATRADDVRAREALIAAHEGDPDYRWVLLEDIFELLPAPRAEFRTAPNDFRVRMPWGYCGSWIWRRTREAEIAVAIAERIDAIRHALTGASAASVIDRAWRNLLIGQHHDIHICGLEADAAKYLDDSLAASQAVIADALATLAPRIGHVTSGSRIVAFNPLPWARTEVLPTGDSPRAVTLPALGFVALEESSSMQSDVRPFAWDDETCRLETPFYHVEWAAGGGIQAMRSADGRSIFSPPKSSGTLAGIIDGRWRESVGRITHASLTTDQALLTEEGEIGELAYRHIWTFYAHSGRIDWRGEITFSGQAVGRPKQAEEEPFPADDGDDAFERLRRVPAFNDHEYKLRLRFFPYVSPYAIGVRDYPFGIAETSDRAVQGLYWTAVSDGQNGLALFNRGLMGSLREADGAFSSVLAFSLPYIWGTRRLNGTYIFELGILPYKGDWRAADLHRRALEYNFAPLTTEVKIVEEPVGESWTPFHDRGRDALLSALYVRDGQTYARFHEMRGDSAEVCFDWMTQPASLTETDLRQRELGGRGQRVHLGAWQILTVRIDH